LRTGGAGGAMFIYIRAVELEKPLASLYVRAVELEKLRVSP
jgi:hypothetical protein